jgi:hemerythrin-like domain-containing protein
MKRAEQLIPLSHDHHQGLVVSQQALRLKTDSPAAQIEQHLLKVKACLEMQARHHFVIEEKYLLEPLAALTGNDNMVQRIYAEHETFRAFTDKPAGQSLEELQAIAALLKDHIKYEEREVFTRAQEVLSTRQLDILWQAHGHLGDDK